jgi:enoyl-CoA hydratase/carnithine racemase
MTYPNDSARRNFLKTAAIASGAPVLGAIAAPVDAQTVPPAIDFAPTTLHDVSASSGAKVTVERRGQIALLGINRPTVQNRIDPETLQQLAEAYYNYDHDPSMRAAILFGNGKHFSRGIDVDSFRSLAGRPPISAIGTINPLATTPGPRLTKPLVVVTHGDTWNMGHELALVADIRIASADTQFAQDEAAHGLFPGGGSTVRFVREVGWGNAMRYILTGDHWNADEAYRMGEVQMTAANTAAALDAAVQIANRIADCAPLGIKASLASAHLGVSPSEEEAFARLYGQLGALFRTQDFQEGLRATAEKRKPVFQGR